MSARKSSYPYFTEGESNRDCDLPVASNINLSFKPSFSSGIPSGAVQIERGRR